MGEQSPVLSNSAMRHLRHLHKSIRAVNAFEYLLITGIVVVPLVAGLIAGVAFLIPEVAQYVCPAVDTADPAALPGSCIPGF